MIERIRGAAKKAIGAVTSKAVQGVKATFGFDFTARFLAGETALDLPIAPDGETVWASARQIATLFDVDRSVAERHIKNIFDNKDLERSVATCAKTAQVQVEGSRSVTREVELYSLDVILAVGYKVGGKRAAEFRKWASGVLRAFIENGYVLDGERLASDTSALSKLAREVRAIRTSEKALYLRVRDVFAACAVDYDPRSDEVRKFFAMLQDVCHYAASGQTASEIVVKRADAARPNMGLTALGNLRPRADDVTVAKNYLSAQELNTMQLVGEGFLNYAEAIVDQQREVTMAELLGQFLALVDFYQYPVFPGYGPGRPTAKVAQQHAKAQLKLFNRRGDPAAPAN